MKIPEVRMRLRTLAIMHGIPELDTLADELIRRSPVRRARPRSKPMDTSLEAAIRAYASAFPAKDFASIASVFGVNPGRVSEAIIGKRT